jgi:hypothetical protein
MAGRVDWFGDAYIKQMAAQTRRNTAAAAKRLQGRIKTEISQSGELRYNPIGKRGKALKRVVRIYGFTHSAPGNPPYEQTGHLRRSIAWELVNVGLGGPAVIGRVGTTEKYGRYLELGTRRMKRRPFIVITLTKNLHEIRSILLGNIGAGGLGAIGAVSNRSGILGRGGIGAGYG